MRRIAAALIAGTALLAALSCASDVQAADTCPNASYRSGAGAVLPDCRAWEQVTPADKRGANPQSDQPARSNPSGDRVLFLSKGYVANADAVGFGSVFASTRALESWSTAGVDPPLDSNSFIANSGTLGYSVDESKALVVSQRKLTPGAVEGASNLYVRDLTTRSYTFVASDPGSALYHYLVDPTGAPASFYAASPDFKHVLFHVPQALTADAVEGNQNLYEWDGGPLTLVSVDSGGTPVGVGDTPQEEQRRVSTDGRRVTFATVSPATGETFLYQRFDRSSTVLISRSHRPGDDPAAPVAASANSWASADGARVTFEGRSAAGGSGGLTSGGVSTLYRWSAASDDLVDLLVGVPGPWLSTDSVFALREVSPDGRYVWFVTSPGATFDDPSLYVLDTSLHRATRVATFDPSANPVPFNPRTSVMRYSPDGTKVALLSDTSLTGYDQTSANGCRFASGAVVPCLEVFGYDALTPATPIACLSCGAAGTHSLGNADLGTDGIYGGPVPHPVTDAGQVFFGTPQPLAPSDANALPDIYGERLGTAHASLISSGTGSEPAALIDASASGDDAFFFTADPLVPQDSDELVDVYDARVNGGIAAQQVPSTPADPCPTANCPGSPVATPAADLPATSAARAPTGRVAFRVARLSAAAKRAASASGHLKVTARVGAAGTLSARASSRVGQRAITVGRASRLARKASAVTLTLRFSRESRRVLARKGRLAVTISVTYSRSSHVLRQSLTLIRRSDRGGAR